MSTATDDHLQGLTYQLGQGFLLLYLTAPLLRTAMPFPFLLNMFHSDLESPTLLSDKERGRVQPF